MKASKLVKKYYPKDILSCYIKKISLIITLTTGASKIYQQETDLPNYA
jgi:hypothetical protein